MVSTTRLYGAAIALVSGSYSLWSASMGRMGTGGWLMLVLGVVVLVHGAVLLTDYADRLSDASGPLMIAYALLMLLNQALLGTGMMADTGGMNGGGMQDGVTGSTVTMGWDAGMVALAVLMLLSGVVMSRDRDADEGM